MQIIKTFNLLILRKLWKILYGRNLKLKSLLNLEVTIKIDNYSIPKRGNVERS